MKNRYLIWFVVAGIFLGAFVSSAIRVDADGFGNDEEPEPVDYTPFFNAFKNHCFWTLSYKLNEDSEWADGIDYLTIEKDWIEDMGYWKFNLIIDVPVPVFSARFSFAVDLPVLDYVEKSGQYQYFLNYSGYSAFFDWSDMMSIPNVEFSHGVIEYYFWFSFKRDNIPAGVYEFDPYFGWTGTGVTQNGLEDQVKAGSYLFTFNGDNANADNITALIDHTGDFNITYGLWYNDTNILVGQTETGYVYGDDTAWYTLNFTSNITLVNNTQYLIGAISNNSASTQCFVMGTSPGGFRKKDIYVWDGNLPNPLVETNNDSYALSIYCNYTIYNDTGDPDEPTNYTLDDEGAYTFNLGNSTIIFLLWCFICWAELKINRIYISVAFIFGISQFLIPSVVFLSGFFTAIFPYWFIASFGFLILGFYKTYKGLKID